jgi:hypothetical protein
LGRLANPPDCSASPDYFGFILHSSGQTVVRCAGGTARFD